MTHQPLGPWAWWQQPETQNRTPQEFTAPANMLAQFNQNMERMIDQMVRFWPGAQLMAANLNEAMPSMHMEQDDDAYIFTCDMPEALADSLELSVHHGTLILRGEYEQNAEDTQKALQGQFAKSGAFEHTLALPVGTSEDEIEASYDDGKLEIRVPKLVDVADGKTVKIRKSASSKKTSSGSSSSKKAA